MTDKRAQAMHMYLNESCTQRHIATTLGVSERTIYSWIRQNSWDRLKQASLAAPVIIADNLCFQLIAMQQSIAEREPGKQFPTLQEAEITRKLVMCIDKLKRYPSITQSMQVLETFRQYVRAANERDSWPIERWMGRFMEARAKGGFRPNDIEYNAENLTPFGMPFEEEVINDIPATTPTESTTTITSDQPENLPQTATQSTENQSPVSMCHAEGSRKQSEVIPEVRPGALPHSIPPEFNLQEFVDEIADENLQGKEVSPETAAAYRQNLALVLKANLLDYLQHPESELQPPNITFPFENQHTTPTSDHQNSRKQSEVTPTSPPHQRRA